jgi:hypothetical protein
VFVVLDIDEDQHVSYEYINVKEQMHTPIGKSSGSELEGNVEGDGEGEHKFMMHVSLPFEDNKKQYIISQLKQQGDYQGRHLIVSKEAFIQGQLFFVSQNVFDLGFRDPVAALMELYISDPLKILDFVYSSVFTSEYSFLKVYLSLLISFSYFLLSSDRDKVILVLRLLQWLLWKYVYT